MSETGAGIQIHPGSGAASAYVSEMLVPVSSCTRERQNQLFVCVSMRVNPCVCVCVFAVSDTHLTLPMIREVRTRVSETGAEHQIHPGSGSESTSGSYMVVPERFVTA